MVKKKKITCPTCFGKGYVCRPQPVTCHGCGGTKWIYVKDLKAEGKRSLGKD